MWQTLQWTSFGYGSDTEETPNNFASRARREFLTEAMSGSEGLKPEICMSDTPIVTYDSLQSHTKPAGMSLEKSKRWSVRTNVATQILLGITTTLLYVKKVTVT
jgi:hypothetical protein